MSQGLDPLPALVERGRGRPGSSGSAGPTGAALAGRPIVLSSNDYLGLSRHADVVAAASEALARYGMGSAATRGAAVDSSLFADLEERLADFKGAEASLVYQSGYAANVGLLPVLVGSGDLIVRDELAHASTRDGAQLSGATQLVYRHRDVDHLADLLTQHRPGREGTVVIATDGVFGMEGDIAPLPDLLDVAERHGALLVVDDAHATGVLGREGRGTVDHFRVNGRVPVQVGTLSKALGAMGGFVGAQRTLRDRLLRSSHPALYSTLPPAAVAAASIAAIDVMRSDPARIERLWSNTRSFKARLATAGFGTSGSETPIVPVPLPSAEVTLRFAEGLRALGVIVQAVTQPPAAAQRPRLRMIVRSELSEQELSTAAEALVRVGRDLHILPD